MNLVTDQVVENPQELAQLARARAAFLSFLNLHFQVLPDVSFVERVRNGDLTSVLEALKSDPSDDVEIATGASLMEDFIDKTRNVDAAKLSDDLGVDRTRLYRGVAPSYGPPPPYEMVWSKNVQDISVLTTIAGIYAEAGLATSPDAHNRVDYIGVELDFVRELASREAAAWESGDADTANKWLKVQSSFMSEHVGAWVPAFIDKAMQQVETDFYKGHMLMLRGFLKSEQQELSELVSEAG